MAFTASLRRSLFVLLGASALVFMFFYWNQNGIRTNQFLADLDKPLKNKLVVLNGEIPPERTWTYKCQDNKCIRQHFLGNHPNDKRIPFMSCTMTCGPSNIWPQPTIKTTLGSNTLTFSSKNIKLKLKTPNRQVDDLYQSAFILFQRDIENLEQNENIVVKPDEIKKSMDDEENLIENLRNYDIDQVIVDVHVTESPDIYLNLGTNETYNLTINHESSIVLVKIVAKSFFGARHALETLQQLIWYDDENEILRIISRGFIDDEPKFNYRGIMLDTSRHYFSVESIKRTILGMAHTKLNRFHWHITDSQSFPFLSKYYPQLAEHGAYSNKEIYTRDDIKEITDFARVRGIQVIPEIDAPAHAGNGWDWGPKHGMGELSLCINQQPWSFYCGEPPCGQLNPKNNNTYKILEKLYTELLELTGPTDYFHLGGDEVNLECWGQFFNDTDLRGVWCDFMLQAFNRLKIANGGVAPKVVSVWSSGLTASSCLSKNSFAVQVWGGSTWQENFDLIDYGYSVIISHVDAWYLDCGFGNWRSTGEGACSPYRTWQNVWKHRPWDRMRLTPNQMKQILGGEAALWTEQVDESVLDSRVWPRAAAIAERLWSDPADEHETDLVPKEVFNRMSVFRNRLIQYGLKAEPIFPKYCAQNQDECI